MRGFLKRVLAYFIDIVIVSLFATCLSNIGFLNWQLNDYNKISKDFGKVNSEYAKFTLNFEKYYSDKKITEKELSKLEKQSKSYSDLVVKNYDDKKISKGEYKKISKEAEKKYKTLYKDYYYEIKKVSIVNNIYYVIIVLLYFIGFQLITEGQTLGKKIMKLKVNSTKGNKVSALQYFLRALILYNVIFYVAEIIIALCVSKKYSYDTFYIVSMIQNVVEWIILFMIAMNKDGRGLHDVLASTVVTDIDGNSLGMSNYETKENNVKDAEFEEVKEEKVVIEEKKKETPKKKTTTRKTTSKKTTTKGTTKKTTASKKSATKKTTSKKASTKKES